MSKVKDNKAFLRGLNALTAKHGLVIGGCGCCGSPWVTEAPKGPEKGFYRVGENGKGDLQFIHPSDKRSWKKYGEGKRNG